VSKDKPSYKPTASNEARAPVISSLENLTLIARKSQSLHVKEDENPLFIETDEKIWVAAHFCFQYDETRKIHRLLIKIKNKFYSWEFIDPGMNIHERFQIVDRDETQDFKKTEILGRRRRL
jgi:hypothetical protein